MMMALLPPSSRSARPSRLPTTWPTRLPIRQLPVAEINGSRLIVNHPFADVISFADAEVENARTPVPLRDIVNDVLNCDGR